MCIINLALLLQLQISCTCFDPYCIILKEKQLMIKDAIVGLTTTFVFISCFSLKMIG